VMSAAIPASFYRLLQRDAASRVALRPLPRRSA
jgi:hypothetical protein